MHLEPSSGMDGDAASRCIRCPLLHTQSGTVQLTCQHLRSRHLLPLRSRPRHLPLLLQAPPPRPPTSSSSPSPSLYTSYTSNQLTEARLHHHHPCLLEHDRR